MPSKILVTGAAGGIGMATVQRILKEGQKVIAVDRPQADFTALRKLEIEVFSADLSKETERDRLVEFATDCDGLVNAAGRMQIKPLLSFTRDEIRELFAINFESIWDLTARLGPRMPVGGSIVNLSSSSAKFVTNTEVGPYAATKSAIASLTRTFSYEFAAKGVRVNAILPGIIDTPMQDQVAQELADRKGITKDEIEFRRLNSIPLKRAGTPEECANLIWFLLSDQSSYMTGQSINITGGWVTT